MTARTLPLDARLQRYVVAHGARESALQRELRRVTRRMPRASMQIGAEQGALMQMLVRVMGARALLGDRHLQRLSALRWRSPCRRPAAFRAAT